MLEPETAAFFQNAGNNCQISCMDRFLKKAGICREIAAFAR